jgi:serine/threonine protein kinase
VSTNSARLPPLVPSGTALFARDEILDNNYRIVDGIAAGGMGEVYRAVHLRLPRALAIKTLHPEFAARPEWVTRFCREARILAGLRHPNIVQVLDFNVAPNGVPYLAMELIEGEDLRAAIDGGRRFDAAEAAAIVRQVASALEAAHSVGVVHRDLKPENVVLATPPGQPPFVKVIDFGLSLRGRETRVTSDRSIIGTPDYMAPEQAQGLREQIDSRTDQFALAALAYVLLTGRTPFSRETPVAVLYAIVHEEPAQLGAAVGWDAAPVERVLHRGLARRRNDRYPSVLAFADALEAALVEGGALPRPTTPAPLRLMPAVTPTISTIELPRALPTLRAGTNAILISVLLAGAVWGGVQVRGRMNMSTVRAGFSRQWQHVRSCVVGETGEARMKMTGRVGKTGDTANTEGRGRR